MRSTPTCIPTHRHYIGAFGKIHAPRVVMACKSDLEHRVKAQDAVTIIQQYDTGLVEASISTETGKERIRKAFQWVFKAMVRQPGQFS